MTRPYPQPLPVLTKAAPIRWRTRNRLIEVGNRANRSIPVRYDSVTIAWVDPGPRSQRLGVLPPRLRSSSLRTQAGGIIPSAPWRRRRLNQSTQGQGSPLEIDDPFKGPMGVDQLGLVEAIGRLG